MKTVNKLLEDLKTYGKNISVLYVEDNEDIRSSTLKILQRFFYNIIEAEDGLDGFNKYKSNTNTIDLVITDIGMPKMNGIEMVSEIKKINHNQQILVISAYNNSDYFTQMINLGIDGYLIKPIESKQFLEAILKSVDKIRLQIENTAYQEELVNKNMQLKELNDSLEIKVKQRTVELENKLYIDDLTGLRSRFKLDIDMQEAKSPALILIDIDYFHSINELYGTNTGDGILKSFAKLLENYAYKKGYVVYRVSGDQFVLFEPDMFIDMQKIENDMYELFELVATKNFSLKQNSEIIELSITAGVVIEKEMMLSKAEMALCYAKNNNMRYVTYHLSIDFSEEIANTAKWLRVLKKGVKKDLFVPSFQPIVNREQKIIKHEALMRLISKEDGIDENTSPIHFLPTAIKTKLYNVISSLVIKKVFKSLEKKKRDISINLSYQDIKNKELVKYLQQTLSNENIAKCIIFEIVESEDIGDFKIIEDFIKTFKDLGVRIAIDDFGTGYSNFTHIMELKPDYLKIDGSLIKDIKTNRDSYELVKAIVQFSKELNIKTIAEYVCNKEVFDIAFELGVDEFQGYYFGKPSIEEED